ncbi:MAG: glycoside hydrolase family 172 protein [Armatimonadota bacterium]
MKRLDSGAALLVVACSLIPTAGIAQSLAELWQLQEGRSRRVSSVNADPSSNRDFLTLQPGDTGDLADLEGPGIIRHIWFTIDAEDSHYPRHLILRAWWDDEATPSIEVPLGDFFAVGNGMRANVNSLAVQTSSEGRALNCFWPMPFARRARLTLENQSSGVVWALYYYIDYDTVPELPQPLATFHAQYRQAYPVVDGQDYVFAEIQGRGHYVGTVLSWWDVERGWPGEGDDRFYVDGEAQASIQGTGTEDYFSDAWGFRKFTELEHGVTVWEGTEEGSRCTAYRWHLRDPIRFASSLRATIEHRGWAIREGKWDGFAHRADRFSSAAFWYQVEPHAGFPPLPPAGQRMPYEEERTELETLLERIEAGSEERTPSRQAGRLWSRGAQVFYSPQTEEEAWLRIPFQVQEGGRWLIYGLLTSSYDYGVWQFVLDGEPLGAPRDMYSANTQLDDVLLGVRELAAGEHVLDVQTVGKNPQSTGVYMGLDALALRR